MKISTRIMSGAMLVVAAVNIVYAVYFVGTERKGALDQLQTTMTENDKLLKVVMAGPLYDGNIEQLDATLDSFFSNPDMVGIELREYNGNIRLTRKRTPGTMGEETTSRAVITRKLDDLGEIVTTYSTARIEQRLRTSRNEILGFSAILIFGLAVVIYTVARGFTRPIVRLTEAARDMASGQLDREIEPRGAEEIQSLGQSFIRMRDAIREKMADLAARNEAMRISEDRLRSVVENTPVVLFALDPQGRFTFSEGKGLAALGLQPGQAVGQSALEVYRDSPSARAAIQRALAGEEFSMVTDVAGIIFEVWYSPVRNAAGELIGTIGVGTDITERKRAENELRTAHALLQGIINATQDLIFVKDTNFTYLACNKAFAEFIGRPEEQIVGHEDAEWFPDQQVRESFRAWDRKILAEGKQFYIEEQVTYPDGRRVPLETLKSPLYSGDGRLLGLIGISRDISERKRASEALQENEKRLRQAVRASQIGIFDHNHLTDTIYWSLQQRLIYGWGSDEAVTLAGFIDQVFPEDRERIAAAVQHAHDPAGDGLYDVEHRIIRRDGEVRWLTTRSQTYFEGEGDARRPVRTFGAAIDITDRRHADDARRESEARLQAAINVSQIGIFDHDQRANTIYWSPQQRQIHGWGPDEPVSLQSFLDLVHPEDRESVLASVRRAHDPAGDGIWDVEHRVIRRDGSVRWLKERSQTFFEGDGDARRPVRTIGAVLDITERKKTEEEQQKLVSIIETSSDFIAISDLNGQLLYVNTAGRNLAGLDNIEETRSKRIPDFLREQDLAILEKELLPSIRQYGSWIGELALRNFKTGMPIPVEMNAFMIRDRSTGQPIALANISRDITDRKQVEAERERLIVELEMRNAELERFTYTVSHDLKSPLITMRGFLGYLEKDALVGNTERIRADIGRITDATDKMDRLLRELLELSRIGRAMNPPEQVPFEEIAREAVGLVEGRIQERGIRVEIATGMPVISGDRVRLVEIVQNLVDNAAKFMGSQPAPLIEVGMRGEERNGKPVFFVRDNGIGIEPRYQEKIFGLFDKLDPKTEGTGIGLAIVKRIIEVHGGTIWLESEGFGNGATFCFTLPRAQTMRNGG